MPLRPIYYDTETTGIKADKDRIVEIAAFDPVLNLSFVELINPGIPIPPEVTAIHKISDEMVAGCPGFNEIGKRFADFCSGDVVLIAHNNDSFDLQFLKAEFSRNDLELPNWKFVDSLKWARRYRPDLPRHSLQFLREIYGVTANNAHRALDDVIVLHQVFSQMTDDLPIEEIYALLSVKKDLSLMPFGKHQGKPLKDVPQDYVQWLAKNGALDKPENEALRTSFEKIGLLAGK